MKAPRTHNEQLSRDGVTYEIHVEEAEGGFWGSWKCCDCKHLGQGTKKCATLDEALAATKANLAPHHQVKHCN